MRRLAHIKNLWKHRVFSQWISLVYTVYGVLAVCRDEFVSAEHQEEWRILKMLPHWPISWWIASTLGTIIIWLFESSYREAKRLQSRIDELEQNEASPLEIIFDPNNPSKRFWSMESPEYENGKPKSNPYWEYRVEIKNNSSKTLRNVSSATEAIGPMPQRPADQLFDKNKKTTYDIKPWCSELVPVARWDIPIIQPGMLVGEGYGPIKVIASADDTKPSVRIFKFDYMREPMLYD